MKLNAYIFIFTSLIYNFIDLGNKELHFISKKFLDDIWYCLIYGHLTFFFYEHTKKSKETLFKLVLWVCFARFIYNFGILINIIEHTPYKATFFVPCFIVTLAIIENTKWLLSHLRR